MAHVLHIVQVVSSLILIGLILLQRTSGDMGGSAFGENSFFQTRRGSERFFFVVTITLAAIFALSSIAVLALSQ